MSQNQNERDEFFSPRLYQYLYCFHRLPPGKRTMRNLIGEMGVPGSTAYGNVGLLTDKGFLAKGGEVYSLTDRGLAVVETDRDTFDNLVFWLCADLGYGDDEAFGLATGFVFRLPIASVRRLADTGASRAALDRARGPGRGALAALPRGRHEARVFVRPASGTTGPGVLLRSQAVCVSDGEGGCALELHAGQVRRIVLALGRRRGTEALLWFPADGAWIQARETAGRLYIRGDALTPEGGPDKDGGIVAHVRVGAAISEKHAPTKAELVLRIAGRAPAPREP
jgi:hypothetical protein